MGFAWHLRQNLRASYGTPVAIAISDDIVISSIVADATTRPQAVLEVFIADDDDGNHDENDEDEDDGEIGRAHV